MTKIETNTPAEICYTLFTRGENSELNFIFDEAVKNETPNAVFEYLPKTLPVHPSSSFEDFQHSFETENWALVHGVGELNGGRYVFMYAKDEGLIVNGIGISDEEVLALL